jgi:hypothetical protein
MQKMSRRRSRSRSWAGVVAPLVIFWYCVYCATPAGAAAMAATGGGAEHQLGNAKYKDPKQALNTRIDDLLQRMTLAEKIGQMSQIERVNATADVMKNCFIGTTRSFEPINLVSVDHREH